MKHLLLFLAVALTQLQGATLWQFTRKVDAGAGSSTTVTGVASSLFGLNASGNLIMLPNSAFIASGGTAGTVTDIGNLTGVVTSTNRATAIADGALSIAKTNTLQAALDAKASLSGATFTGAVDASISLTTPALTIGDQVTFNNSIFTYGGGAAAAHRTALGLVIGTNVQAYDADLTTWAGITPGTNVATALAVNVGSAGAPVLYNGALGTPTSGVATNLTGTASGLSIGGNAATATSAASAATWTTARTLWGSSVNGSANITAGLVAPSIQPAADSTTAVRLFKSDGTTAVGTWDTTNARLGLGVTPTKTLDVLGTVQIRADAASQRYLSFVNAANNVEYFTLDSNAGGSPVFNIRGRSSFIVSNSTTDLFTVGTGGASTFAGTLAVTGTVTAGAGVIQSPPASATPANNGQLLFEATSNTSLTVKMRGTDGTVRSVVLTLAP